jgi:hypothetical protein
MRLLLAAPRSKQLALALAAAFWLTIVIFAFGTVTVYDTTGRAFEEVTEGSVWRVTSYSLPGLLACAVGFWWFGPTSSRWDFSLMGNNRHEIGNPQCPQCLFSQAIRCECGGLRHVGFVREVYDEEKDQQIYENATRCDHCGRETWPQ